jgi:hypothetical protein
VIERTARHASWYASLPAKPGLGTDLLPGLDQRPDAHVRITTAADLP